MTRVFREGKKHPKKRQKFNSSHQKYSPQNTLFYLHVVLIQSYQTSINLIIYHFYFHPFWSSVFLNGHTFRNMHEGNEEGLYYLSEIKT
jgi:hypothetical protein